MLCSWILEEETAITVISLVLILVMQALEVHILNPVISLNANLTLQNS